MNIQSNHQTQLDLHYSILTWLNLNYPNSSQQSIQQDCNLIISKIKVLTYEYCQKLLNEQSEIKIQLLYEYINETFINSNDYYQIFNPQEIIKYKNNLFEAVIVPIITYFMKQINCLDVKINVNQYQFYLENLIKDKNTILNTDNNGIIQCLCCETQFQDYSVLNDSKFCYRCGKLFHTKCFGLSGGQLYQCPFCFLVYCLPDREVVHTIFQAYIPSLSVTQSQICTSIISQQFQLSHLFTQQLLIQLRCTRIQEQIQYQIMWPQICDIYLDESIAITYQPLNQNSPLKKRHDTFIVFPIKQLVNSQNIKISEHSSNVKAWHLVTLVAIKERNQQQIFSNLSQNSFHTLSQAKSKQYLKSLFTQSAVSGLQIERLVISNKCQYYCSKILNPCRSRHCKTHYQPFDLYSFICSSVKAKSSIKRWKCPICGIRAYDIVYDKYLQKLMKQQQNIKDEASQKQINNQFHKRLNEKNTSLTNAYFQDKLIIRNN